VPHGWASIDLCFARLVDGSARAGVHRPEAGTTRTTRGPAGRRPSRRRHQNVAPLPALLCHACMCPAFHSARIVVLACEAKRPDRETVCSHVTLTVTQAFTTTSSILCHRHCVAACGFRRFVPKFFCFSYFNIFIFYLINII
jgi:hypothetical protein